MRASKTRSSVTAKGQTEGLAGRIPLSTVVGTPLGHIRLPILATFSQGIGYLVKPDGRLRADPGKDVMRNRLRIPADANRLQPKFVADLSGLGPVVLTSVRCRISRTRRAVL